MPIGYHSVITLLNGTGLLEDDVNITQDWVFAGAGDPLPTDFLALDNALQSFLVDIPTGSTASVSAFISPVILRAGGGRVEVWEVPDAPGLLGSPVYTGAPFTLDASSDTLGLPSEVAYVQSEQGDLTDVPETAPNPSPPPATIRPASRRRGRFYVGPLNGQATETSGTPLRVFPNSIFRTAVRQATRQFLGLEAAAADWLLAVWSRSDWAMYSVENLKDDNAFDTQRRRGEAPTAATTTAFPGT